MKIIDKTINPQLTALSAGEPEPVTFTEHLEANIHRDLSGGWQALRGASPSDCAILIALSLNFSPLSSQGRSLV